MMKNLKRFKVKGKDTSPFLFISYLLKEFLNINNYITSIIVGVVINFLQQGNPLASIVPFIIPILVQALSKTSIKYKNLYKDILLLLPMERVDPAFLMDRDGNILYSIGITRETFKNNSISNYNNFITMDSKFGRVYSSITSKWYKEERKDIDDKILVWLSDITNEINLEKRIRLQGEFNNSIFNDLENIMYQDVYENLADLLIMDGYKGIFIAKLSRDKKELVGVVYKEGRRGIKKSDTVRISMGSESPIIFSRERGEIVKGEIEDFTSPDDFYSKYSFDKKVTGFLGFNVTNFINYHNGDLSLIAFNKVGEFKEFEVKSIESVVDSARTLDALMLLARDSDNRFLESIEGLCAAAEYSDEITGKHIYRVNRYSELIGRTIGLDSKKVLWLGQTAAIHDIGKVAIPELIKLDRKYSESERSQMEMHTVIGANIIRKMIIRSSKPDKRLILAREIALLHHQEWCGKGYPGIVKEDGTYLDEFKDDPDFYRNLRPLKGDEIPIEALVVSLADRYDALRSPRQYKPGFSHEKVKNILAKDDRTGRTGEEIFGPTVYKAFLSIEDKMDRIYEEMKD